MTTPPPQEGPTVLAVGRPYPDAVAAHRPGTLWIPETGLLLCGQPGLTQDEITSWGPRTRVHFTPYRSLIVASVQYLDAAQVEYPGTPVEGDLPDWVAGDSDAHLFLQMVFVDSNTGIVVDMGVFTTSPHVAKVLRSDATTRWSHEVTAQEATQDYLEFQRLYPTFKAVRAAAMASCRPGD